MRKLILMTLTVGLLSACEQNYLPKPPGYNRIDLPSHSFSTLDGEYPYSLEYSKHGRVEPDSFNLDEKNWININYQDFDAKVHLTYRPINEQYDFRSLSTDAFNLTAKHQQKAYGISENVLITPEGYTGVVAELSGEVPTQFQFFVTDSTEHFLRGALYFNTSMKNDSLSPVIEFIKVDLAHLMNSVKFQD
ncbi:gliding motility lipoprotein GldD [Algoriphagus vanfongensis]|uniref:gliding motility lipoprotein GldD n=1 Tax=Algoriphagus vanfongensis TaxID=426371 RepID=UPI00054F4BFF|nr:gliding motility lipoprotein GldD [Algoriphagus vanfongensis]